MNDFPGVISLFIACIEIVFFINLLIFSEKNIENKLIILLVALLFSYQFMEFFMCYTENYSYILVYVSFFIISFLPPLMLYFVLTVKKIKNLKFAPIIFLPIIILLIYYLSVLTGFEITECTVLFAAYEMPLGDLYGVIYYSPVIISVFILLKVILSESNKDKKLNLIIALSGILFAFFPVALIIAMFPELIDYVESFFCKAASIIAFTFTIYGIRNNSKKEVVSNE